ncbi:hypothetical protein JCM16303_003225 [Sporobolomyces ruberrimus]
MSLFTRSYATTEQLEMSRIAASSSPRHDGEQQQQSTSLLRSNRHIPEELRAPPFVPDQEVPGVGQEEDPFRGDRGSEEDGQRRDDDSVPATEESIFATTAKSSDLLEASEEKEKKRARTSQIGKMLFPPPTLVEDGSSQIGPRTKRHSYGGSASQHSQVVLNPLSASTSSLPVASSRIPRHTLKSPTKKTLSPTNHQRRTASTTHSSSSASSHSSGSTSLTSVSEGTLLALPLAKQLASLKERNHALAQASTVSNAKLGKATERIRQLEETLASIEASRGLDAEGWEAEASRLAQELSLLQQQQVDSPKLDELESRASKAERALAIEQSKKRRAKEMINKLKCELINRRWKEKYEIELLEKEERNWEMKVVEAECEIAVLKGELGCERAEREELEGIVAILKERVSTLSTARKILLDSFNTSEATVSSLRTSLSRAQKDIVDRQHEVERLKDEVEDLKTGLEEARTQSGDGQAEIQEKNQTLRTQVKELKAQLKDSQTALKLAQKSTTSATSSLETTKDAFAALQAKYDALSSTTSAPPSLVSKSAPKARSAVKEKERSVPEPEPEVEAESDGEVEEVEHVEPSPKRKAATKTKETKKKPETNKRSRREEEEEEAVSAVTVKPKAKQPANPISKKSSRDVEPSGSEAVEEEDDDETPRPTPASPPAKKRKAAVLADKPTNAKKEKVGITKVKKDKSGAKKKLSLDLSEDDLPPPAPKEEPAKKKKRKLFGDGAKKGFDWQTQIENADVNGLIPGNLSPIKLDRTGGKKMGILGLGALGGAKKSIF